MGAGQTCTRWGEQRVDRECVLSEISCPALCQPHLVLSPYVPQITENSDIIESGSFETASRAMAVHNDSVFRAAEDRLEVRGRDRRGGGGRAWRLGWGRVEAWT